MTTESSSPIMTSIRNVVALLAPAQALTSQLPKFSESMIRKPRPGNPLQDAPSPIPWPSYAVDSQHTSMVDLLKSQPAVKVVAIGEHHNQ